MIPLSKGDHFVTYNTRHMPFKLLQRLRAIGAMHTPRKSVEHVLVDCLRRSIHEIECAALDDYKRRVKGEAKK